MAFTRQYKAFLRPEKRVPRSQIRPRNIYRITTYKGGDPITKSGEEARYVFVIGIVDGKAHCIKLNDIKPLDFTNFINKLRDKRIPIGSDQSLELLLKKFSKDGNNLFSSFIKNNSKLYSRSLSNYRTYKLNPPIPEGQDDATAVAAVKEIVGPGLAGFKKSVESQ